jgi:hypothetical protein
MDKRFWLEEYLDVIGRGLRAGRIFLIYKDNRMAAAAVCFPPGSTFDSAKDPQNVHFRYVQEHMSPDQEAYLKEVCYFLLRCY